MTTHIVRMISKDEATNLLGIPRSSWADLGRELGTRFNAALTVLYVGHPDEDQEGDRADCITGIRVDVAVPGDARLDALAIIDYLGPAVDDLIERYTHTNIPQAR